MNTIPADPAALLAAIVESSDDAIVGKTLEGNILSWNAAAERIFGYSAQEIAGRSVRTLIPTDRQQEEDNILASIGRGERVPTFETVRLHKDGSEIPLAITVSPVRDAQGRVVAASKIARDISEQKRVIARLEDSERRLRLLADNMSQLAWIADASGSIFWYNRRWFEYTGTSLEQMGGRGWTEVHHPDHVDRVVERILHCFDTGEVWEDTFPLRGADGGYRWFLSRALPIRDGSDEIVYWFGTSTDVTEMRDAEQRIELLLHEVNHRSKNMLAMIQAVARRSINGQDDFLRGFEQRIRALAANQDVLVNRAWSSVPVRDMVEAQLRFLGDSVSQCELSGPDVLLSPAAAEALAMAIHELATNALKYGALSNANGRVRLVWETDELDANGRFLMRWIERGGPPIQSPQRTGFGTTILADVPRSKLSAQVDLEYLPEGFCWTLSCALGDLGGQSGNTPGFRAG